MARCVRCLGNKRVQGMGWIEIDCPNCNGLGVVTDKLSDIVDMKKLSKGEDVELVESTSAVSTDEPFSPATGELSKSDGFMERVKAASDSRGTKRAKG